VGALVIATAIAIANVCGFLFLRSAGGGSDIAAREHAHPRIAGDVRLQVDPARDIAAFRAEKQQLLDSYGWVDREHGIARIPIERAMAMLATRRNVVGGAP
jgi:hypothetical protein